MDRKQEAAWWVEARAIAARHTHGAAETADDLAQDLAVAALEREATPAREGAWLERVSRNARIDRWRVERRRGELMADVPSPEARVDPERALLARERRGFVRRAILALPRPLRRATLARFHADLAFDDIAARLGTRPVTARTRVHRALASLRARLGALRVLVPIAPGAQAAVLSFALVAGVARPAAFPSPAAPPAREVASTGSHVHARLDPLPRASVPAVVFAWPRRLARATPHRASEAPVAAPPAERASPSAIQKLSFEDDFVPGELVGPDGIGMVSLTATSHESLIELRWQLIAELVKTLEEL
jgi:RNA polymerase sigma-70 factor, ECF subfamily